MNVNDVTGEIVDAAIAVHSELGPGLLESAYEVCLAHELRSRGSDVVSQVPLPVVYRGVEIDIAYRIDLVVDDSVIVEVKAVQKMMPVHEAQLLSYLRLSSYNVGLLINFHEKQLKDGIVRLINETARRSSLRSPRPLR